MPEETLRATAPSDAELITAVRAGDGRAYEELYRRHVQAAMAVGRHLTGSKSDAEDVVSEAFTRVLSALQRGAGPEMAFRPYLLTSVRNAFYDRTRKDKRVDVTDDVPEDIGLVLAAAARSDEDSERRMAAEAFASLPERWQLVLWHTEVEGMTPAEVGPLLGLAPNAVAALAYRAREGLRQAYLNAHIQTPLPAACAEIVPKLGAYVRNDLSNRDRRKVEEHLEHCDRCPAILAELEEAGSRLRIALIPLIAGIPVAAYLGGIGTGAAGGLLAWGSRVGQRFSQLGPVGQAATVVGAAMVAGALAVGTVAVAHNVGGGPGGDRAAVTSGGPRSAGRGGAGGGSGPSASVDVPATPSAPPPTASTVPAAAGAGVGAGTGGTGGGGGPASPTGTTLAPGGGSTNTTAPGGTVVPITPAGPTSPSTAPPTSGPTTTVPPPGGLTVAMTSPGPVYAGATVGLSVAVGNGVTASARAVAPSARAARSFARAAALPAGLAAAAAGPLTFTLPLSSGLSFAGVDNGSWSCSVASAVLRCVMPAPAAGASSAGIVQIAVAVNAPHTITLQASITDGVAPPVNGAPLVITVRPPPPGISDVVVDRADLALLGNAVVTCNPVSALLRCPTARDDPAAAGVLADKQLQLMTYVDVDGDASTFDSSTSTLALPAGAEVLKARLVWGGALEGGLLGAPAPSAGANGSVRLDGPGGGPVAVHASTVSPDPAVGTHYVASADVTSIVASGGGGAYTVANVQTGTGRNMFGGWALQVVYRDPAAPMRLIGLADQVFTLNRGASVKVELGGLVASTVARPAAVSFAAVEGDYSLVPERLLFNGATLSNAGNAPNDPMNGSITTPGARNPAYVNNFGFDADRFQTAVAPGDTAADMTISTVNDRVRVAAIGISVLL